MVSSYYLKANKLIEKIINDETCCDEQKLSTLLALDETIENGLELIMNKQKKV